MYFECQGKIYTYFSRVKLIYNNVYHMKISGREGVHFCNLMYNIKKKIYKNQENFVYIAQEEIYVYKKCIPQKGRQVGGKNFPWKEERREEIVSVHIRSHKGGLS